MTDQRTTCQRIDKKLERIRLERLNAERDAMLNKGLGNRRLRGTQHAIGGWRTYGIMSFRG